MFVQDALVSKDFYERVFEVKTVYEDENSAAFKFDNMIVNLLAIPEAHGLITPAIVGDASHGSNFQLTIWVDDADAACASLTSKGVSLINGPMDRVWGMRTACFADPDGHIWEVAQSLN
ncbi:MAG: VOC family protein [Chthonomonadales bacterium]